MFVEVVSRFIPGLRGVGGGERKKKDWPKEPQSSIFLDLSFHDRIYTSLPNFLSLHSLEQPNSTEGRDICITPSRTHTPKRSDGVGDVRETETTNRPYVIRDTIS